MKTNTCAASTCRNCQFFSPDRECYDSCSKLNAPVDGKWSRCKIGTVAFGTVNQ